MSLINFKFSNYISDMSGISYLALQEFWFQKLQNTNVMSRLRLLIVMFVMKYTIFYYIIYQIVKFVQNILFVNVNYQIIKFVC